MRRIPTLLVDDEPLARERLRALLASDPEFECVGEAGDVVQALEAIRRLSPELVFLDIQMPGGSGLELLRALTPSEMPVVVFVTAFDHHAVDAFDLQAIDYLLKPFDVDRFARALRRAKDRVRATRRSRDPDETAGGVADLTESVDRLMRTLQHFSSISSGSATGGASGTPSGTPSGTSSRGSSRRLVVQDGDRAFFVRDDEIDWIEAEGNYVALHVGATKHLHREPLKDLEARLDSSRFLRIHRSIVVNLDRVRELRPWFHGAYVVVLRDGTELTSGRTYSAQVRALLDGRESSGSAPGS